MAVAADVPRKYDLVIDGEGYVLADNWTGGDSSNAAQKAIHSFAPPFIPRTNIHSTGYGDDDEEFWLAASQNDWSLGEQQKYFRPDDPSAKRRYWSGSSIDVTNPGSVSLRRAVKSITAAANVSAMYHKFNSAADGELVYTTSTNLYSVDPAGSVTDEGAHGYGATPQCVTADSTLNLMGGQSNTLGVRQWNGSAFATFAAATDKYDQLAFVNNSLYGIATNSARNLVRFDSAGTASVLFSWTIVTGATRAGEIPFLRTFGSKLLILFPNTVDGPELWVYDGVGVTLVATFPANFLAQSIEIAAGTVFVGGAFSRATGASTFQWRPAVFYYSNGSTGLLWEANDYSTSTAALTSIRGSALSFFNGGLIITDDTTASFLYYNISTGGVHTIGSYTAVTGRQMMASSGSSFLFGANGDDSLYFYPDTSLPTSGYVTSSLIDFDSSLNKLFRGIKVEFEDGSDGNGGTVDIAYRVGDVDGSYTTLQSDATSGTEYTLSGISGRSISYKITLNKGTSTDGPVLKRVYVRAVPLANTYHRARYNIAAWGREGKSPVVLRDQTHDPRTGLDIAEGLMMAAESQTALSITDKFETYTGIVETCELIEFRDSEFVGQITVREV